MSTDSSFIDENQPNEEEKKNPSEEEKAGGTGSKKDIVYVPIEVDYDDPSFNKLTKKELYNAIKHLRHQLEEVKVSREGVDNVQYIEKFVKDFASKL